MAGLDFGLSLGPYDAPQRHCFYDSEEEEGVDESRLETPEKLFTLENSSHLFCKLLVITTSSVADMFITSHVVLDSSSCASVTTKRCLKVLKGKYFNRDGVQANAVTEDATVSKFYSVKDRTGVCVCVHEQTLKEEFCNYWGRKVYIYIYAYYRGIGVKGDYVNLYVFNDIYRLLNSQNHSMLLFSIPYPSILISLWKTLRTM